MTDEALEELKGKVAALGEEAVLKMLEDWRKAHLYHPAWVEHSFHDIFGTWPIIEPPPPSPPPPYIAPELRDWIEAKRRAFKERIAKENTEQRPTPTSPTPTSRRAKKTVNPDGSNVIPMKR